MNQIRLLAWKTSLHQNPSLHLSPLSPFQPNKFDFTGIEEPATPSNNQMRSRLGSFLHHTSNKSPGVFSSSWNQL
ncbi:hypothetical protein [Nostoc sp.]|uniref:hypothetical protein n=1 Tax=Nostoc sp. TaxID=1180 RepID=UPI002FF63FD3